MTSPAPLTMVPLATHDDLAEASALYRKVFDFDAPDFGVNPRLLRSLLHNGGSAVGGRAPDGVLVAFAYGFMGAENGHLYHYSQAAVIHPAYQGRGLGRALKMAQRDVALKHGASEMRWTYDPLLARNAHFNLDVLGAVGSAFSRSFYAEPDSDRVTVRWDLTVPVGCCAKAELRPSPELADPGKWLTPVTEGSSVWLALPADFSALLIDAPSEARRLRSRSVEIFEELFDGNRIADSCRLLQRTGTAVYRFRADQS